MSGFKAGCFVFFLGTSLSLSAQIVFNGGAKMVINAGTSVNPVFVVLNQPPVNPILTSGTTDGIIMEAEYNRLQVNLGTATTTISVPYMSTALEQMPLTVNPTTGGVGSGNIRFSGIVAPTRATGFDNFIYKPSDVTNMGSLGFSNNSAKTIDRFWIIDANGYFTRPAVTLNFTYVDDEWASNGGNTILESFLRAQRFNSTINDWGGYTDYTPMGTINTFANTVTSVTVSPAAFYRSWTLNDNTSILPLELIHFEAGCDMNSIHIQWATASETNISNYVIEQSLNGVDFDPIATIKAKDNTNTNNYYSFETISNRLGIIYYRLKQIDFQNQYVYSKIIFADCNSNRGDSFTVYPNPNTGSFSIVSSQSASYSITNELGQLIKQIATDEAYNKVEITGLSNGIYFITERAANSIITKKMIVTNN